MYVLKMQRVDQLEDSQPVCLFKSEDYDEILDFVNKERVQDYREGSTVKHYRRGGPLEMYRLPRPPDTGIVPYHDVKDFLRQKLLEYKTFLDSIPHVK